MGSSYRLFVLFFGICFFTDLGNSQVGQCTGHGCQCLSYECCLQVVENSDPGTQVGSASISTFLTQIYANNTNSAYTSNSDIFSINAASGNLTTKQRIDRENITEGNDDNCIRIVVNVNFEGGSEPLFFAIDIVDINDNPPVISANTISIPETTESQPNINCQNPIIRNELSKLVATDIDAGANAEIEYSITDSTIFTIPNPSVLCINNVILLDRDVPDYEPYTFTLFATDKGTPPLNTSISVTLHLIDQNDNIPVFAENGTLQVREDSQPGELIHTFVAVDADVGLNGDPEYIRYSIEPSTVPFAINETTGELTLVDNLDAEIKSTYSITVTAVDGGGLAGTTDVTVNVEDINEPAMFTIEKTEIEVEENKIDTTLGIRITIIDNDLTDANKNNTPVIVSGNEFFTVTSISNIFLITQSNEIDREKNSTFEIVVKLFEGGNPVFDNQIRTIQVRVMDVNDNAPNMKTTFFQYVENNDGFQMVTFLKDHICDRDEGNNSEIASIELVSVFNSSLVNLTDRFASLNNALTGGTLIAPALDREEVGDIITFNINITDRGKPVQLWNTATFTVEIIDLNDNKPIFVNTSYYFVIRENLPAGTAIGMVEAVDLDKNENGTVIYSLIQTSEFFSINPVTGSIESLIVFDRELESTYEIFVNARDNATEPFNALSPVSVRIEILDENDNYPSFSRTSYSFEIGINEQVGFVVGEVTANDLDYGINSQIEYRLEPFVIYFEIDSQGVIRVNEHLQTETIFNLSVIAYNPDSTHINTTADVTINVVQTTLSQIDTAVISGVPGFLLILFLVFGISIICCCCRKNKKAKYDVNKQSSHLNNLSERTDSIKKPILKQVPASSSTQGRGRVQFSEMVRETHYDHQQAVTGDTILRKESTTNFGSSDESPQAPSRGPPPIHNGSLPSTTLPVVELEMSPGQHVNGINGNGLHSRYDMHHMHQHSPMHLREDMPDHPVLEYAHSQGTTSTTSEVNSYNSGEEESTFSDVASNMNTSIPRFQADDHPPELHRFVPPPSHPPLHPHLHSHTHTSHMSSPSHLEQLHAHNLASLAAAAAAADASYEDDELTPTHSHNLEHGHSSLSSQTHSSSHPIPGHQILTHMNPPPVRPMHVHTNGRNFPHPLVMPDAYPHVAMPDIRRFPHEPYTASFSDYGDNSTYASTELDEALDFEFEAEPGFCSLTATDYDENEDR